MARQKEIPGTERPKHPEVDAAAEGYVKVRDKRIKLSADEKAAKAALVEAMRAAGLKVYRDDEAGLIVALAEKTDVKVTEVDDEPEGDPDDL
jgi:hypothetical protein